jgi:hypothetical protein
MVASATNRRWAGRSADAAVALAFVALAFFVTADLWRDPDRRVVAFLGGADDLLLQWQLAHASHIVRHLCNPFFTTDMNSPLGINLAGNASILGLGLPLVPLTELAGPGFTLAFVATAALAFTALAWYWLMARPMGLIRSAAFAGALLCGFAPPLVNEGWYGHQHIAAQFLVPLIVWRVVRLANGSRPIRDGIVLGLLVVYQAFISEEILLFTAMGVTAFLAAHGLLRPDSSRHFRALVRGGTVAVAVGVVLLAVPLAYQFAGPAHYRGSPIDPQPFHADVLDYVRIPAWSERGVRSYPVLSLPVVGVVLAGSWWLRRNALYMASLAVLLLMMLLSLGGEITVGGRAIGVPGPWHVTGVPVLEWVVPERLGHLTVPPAGICLAILVDHARRYRPGRIVATVAVAAALLTLVPARYETITLPPIPEFIRDGDWREHLPAGRTLVTVPTPTLASFAGMRWASAARGDIAIPGGYFIGPSADGTRTLFGPPPTWTATMLANVGATGEVHRVAEGDRERFLADLAYWRAGLLALVPEEPQARALEETVTGFLGPPRDVKGVRIWVVR